VKHGAAHFKKQSIWYIDWSTVRDKYFSNDIALVEDPRNLFDKSVHNWLRSSQDVPNSILNRIIAKAVRITGW
jgi:hypothetical protein